MLQAAKKTSFVLTLGFFFLIFLIPLQGGWGWLLTTERSADGLYPAGPGMWAAAPPGIVALWLANRLAGLLFERAGVSPGRWSVFRRNLDSRSRLGRAGERARSTGRAVDQGFAS